MSRLLRFIPICTISIIFIFQIIVQSFPISHTIFVNGDALCTCGCGHTVLACDQSHGTMQSNCKCQHDKEVEKRIHFAQNKIDNFIIHCVNSSNYVAQVDILNSINDFLQDQFVNEIIIPPPRFS